MNIILTPDSVLKHFCGPVKLENLFSKHFTNLKMIYQLKILKIHFFAPPPAPGLKFQNFMFYLKLY
jgi:hypothetical protein